MGHTRQPNVLGEPLAPAQVRVWNTLLAGVACPFRFVAAAVGAVPGARPLGGALRGGLFWLSVHVATALLVESGAKLL